MKNINELPNAADLAQSITESQNAKDREEMSELIYAIEGAASQLKKTVEVKAVSLVNQILLEKKGYKVRNKSKGMNEYAIEISWV